MFYSKNHLYAMLLFFVFMKAFKYLNFNRVMGQLSNTLKKCAKDMMYFTLIFVIVFCAYSELGYMLFGNVVEDFSSIGLAMFTLLRTTLGDFQYDEIERADKVLAPMYFLSFIYLVFFVLLNMFLAIISDTYTNIRTEIATGPDELQMSEYLRDKFYRLLRKLKIKNFFDNEDVKDENSAAVEHVTQLLTKNGFDQIEIAMFFDRYTVNPVVDLKVENANGLISDQDTNEAPADDQNVNQSVPQEVAVLQKQQQKLERLDETISELFDQVKLLLDRLDRMESTKK
ncbi:unnamed protein product [Callosobruchus maculatus]|uniref:Polycystin cation channel PKD1/PKD2 domain-containing protein n=1 Tax=Callosobruchus maculatus TaxID=64391 RepID=A0A653CEZ8_CALMS|nr:unnamed protein product [Callosobruchus maculatus]